MRAPLLPGRLRALTTGARVANLAILTMTISGCASLPRATENGEVKSLWSKISTKDFICVHGIGAVPPVIKMYLSKKCLRREPIGVDES